MLKSFIFFTYINVTVLNPIWLKTQKNLLLYRHPFCLISKEACEIEECSAEKTAMLVVLINLSYFCFSLRIRLEPAMRIFIFVAASRISSWLEIDKDLRKKRVSLISFKSLSTLVSEKFMLS